MIEVHLGNGGGSGTLADVTSNGALCTSVVPVPGKDVKASNAQAIKNLSGKFVNASDSASMNVDGSSIAVEFSIGSNTTHIRTIKEVRLLFHSTQMDITSNEARRFGAAAASPGLTNGLTLHTDQTGVTTNIFIDPVQVIGEFYNYAAGGLNTAIINDKDAVAASTDLLLIIIKLAAPVVLMAGSTDKVAVTVQDDLQALAKFEAYYYGTQQVI